MMQQKLAVLEGKLQGKLHYNDTMRRLYATDASAYRELPLAVAFPETATDIRTLIDFARSEGTSLIPRTAGTSLAGQVVGNGIVVDVSLHFRQIIELNEEEGWVRVQPGVNRDELNMYLAPYGLYFGPETSTSNRCMVGGMVGNNSCGSNSIVYGSTREHLLELKGFLSDGAEVAFGPLSRSEFHRKVKGEGVKSPLEQELYGQIHEMLSNEQNALEIRKEFPKPSIPRRNTGYALDLLLDTAPFTPGGEDFNFCKLIAGSEGTLCFITELKLRLVAVPPAHTGLVCIHFNTVDEALRANIVALAYQPRACELMDNYILECTKANIEQRQNRFFVKDNPGAILVVEFGEASEEAVKQKAADLQAALLEQELGYHFPLVVGEDTKRVWALRKAGLGLLSNVKGDSKPVPVIEDTAVDVLELPAFIREFNETLKKYNLFCVHYAHAGSGELHLRPILNLKTEEGNQLFRTIATEIAHLVKKYKGSLSGEHGDGRLRAEFIEFMIGGHNYKLLKQLKQGWDPQGIFNPGKIVNAPPMNESLRYTPGQEVPVFDTVFDWSETDGIIRAAELCNGSGDCRKSHLIGGTMCPSYMATRNERDTTRGRANMMREMLQNSTKANRFDHEEIKEVMDLCISCKGCKAECPSNVDVAKLKTEWQQQYNDANGVPLRSRLVAGFGKGNAVASKVPWLYNALMKGGITAALAKKAVGFAPERSMPLLHSTTFRQWFQKNRQALNSTLNGNRKGKVLLFCDEFTNYNDVPLGITTAKLLSRLGYELDMPEHLESGRTYLSKGFLREAKKIAQQNIDRLAPLVSPQVPIIGIEPSAILTLRDEYLSLCRPDQKEQAVSLGENALLVDEFIARERDEGRLSSELFTAEARVVKLHGHCHQKALSSLVFTKKMLSLPANYQVQLIPSGCCGMAGSFGYEKEHYKVSMQIGELVLFPTVRRQPEEVLIAAPGTSCRHQIKDGTGRVAKHPVEILWESLKQ
ncbi:FAD-binding and (Fe-S)-binding domain-containing protein [Nafulsella turpanensis]|uniref:FAD-binding and (Fe-S)-binding domain-containing protein n=1 Tax=Nafulsella turpanensis TaxID=1265690 RepID=UPI000378FB35|nr:FAD-binding and (Fe-S)-binding domain-containing protein [Nafulsella turpanensis]